MKPMKNDMSKTFLLAALSVGITVFGQTRPINVFTSIPENWWYEP